MDHFGEYDTHPGCVEFRVGFPLGELKSMRDESWVS